MRRPFLSPPGPTPQVRLTRFHFLCMLFGRMGAKAKAKGKNARADEIVVPDKLFFRIGEVARLCSLPAYVLRFWETEFPHLAPKKSVTGQRLYRQRAVQNVVRIKELLQEQGFTIAGARAVLKQDARPTKTQAGLFAHSSRGSAKELKQVRAGLQD